MSKEGRPLRQEPIKNSKDRVFARAGLVILSMGSIGSVPVSAEAAIVERNQGEVPSKQGLDDLTRTMGITFAGNEVALNAEINKEVKYKGVFRQGSRFYEVNGVVYEGDTQTIAYKGRTLGPARFIGSALGIQDKDITFDSKTKIATFKKGTTVVKIKQNSCDYWVNGVKKKSDVEAIVRDGRTMVPFRNIAEAFKSEVGYDGATKTVFVGYNASERSKYLSELNQKYDKVYSVGLKYAQVPMDIGPAEGFFEVEPYTGLAVMFESGYASKIGEFNDAMGKSMIPTVAKNLDKNLGIEFFYGSDKEVFGFGSKGVYLMSKDGKGKKIDLPIAYSNTNTIKAVEDGKNSGVYVVDKDGKLQVKYNKDLGKFATEKEIKEYGARKVLYDEMQKIIVGDPNKEMVVDNNYMNLHERCNYVNVLHFNKTDVENYLKTGVADGFEAIKDENGIDVAIKMKNEFGFGINEANFDKAIDWIRANDVDRFHRMVKSAHFFGSDFGIVGQVVSIGEATWDYIGGFPIVAIMAVKHERMWQDMLVDAYTESIAIEKNNLGWTVKRGGIEKGNEMIKALEEWKNEGLISQGEYDSEKSVAQNIIDYYKQLP